MITMTDDKLEGEGRNVMKHPAGIFLQMLTKITKNLGEYSGCPSRDPNVVLLEYECTAVKLKVKVNVSLSTPRTHTEGGTAPLIRNLDITRR
jgi:hypothetical protein